jgi:hypothetical protein
MKENRRLSSLLLLLTSYDNVRTSNSYNDNVCTDACGVLYVCVCVCVFSQLPIVAIMGPEEEKRTMKEAREERRRRERQENEIDFFSCVLTPFFLRTRCYILVMYGGYI